MVFPKGKFELNLIIIFDLNEKKMYNLIAYLIQSIWLVIQ